MEGPGKDFYLKILSEKRNENHKRNLFENMKIIITYENHTKIHDNQKRKSHGTNEKHQTM